MCYFFFNQKIYLWSSTYIKHKWEISDFYITLISYVCPLHYMCMKYRVLCLNLLTFDCKDHCFLRRGREGFLRAWWEIMTLHGWFGSARQLSFHLEWVKQREPLLIQTYFVCFFAKLFVSLPYVIYILDWCWAVGSQCVHAPVRIHVGQMNRICYIGQKECQKRQLRQAPVWDQTTCLTLKELSDALKKTLIFVKIWERLR